MSTSIFNIPHFQHLLQEAASNPKGMIACFIVRDTVKFCVYIDFNQQIFSYGFAISHIALRDEPARNFTKQS